MNDAATEMPRYKCHKEVHALKIERIDLDSTIAIAEGRDTDGSAMITPSDPGFATFKVDHEFLRKHSPKVGGYYVVYKDGYKSFSPAEAFEDGYSRL